MRRGPKPAKSKLESKPPVARKSPKDDAARVRDLEKRLAETLEREAEASKREAVALGQLQARDRELVEAREQQTATSEILRALSRLQTDEQPVFESIADSAMRLFAAHSAVILRYDGELIRLAAARGDRSSERMLKRLQAPRHPEESRLSGQAILTRTVREIVDVETDTSLVPEVLEIAGEVGWRSAIYGPMLRADDVVGVIGVHREKPGAFSPSDIGELQTFADQAVIAIENVRLFSELQQKNQALTNAHAQVTEALDQQTATSEILRVISSSPTDLQPVFDAILQSARRLLGARTTSVFRRLADEIHLEAFTSTGEAGDAAYTSLFPMSLDDYRERFPFAMQDWVRGSVTHVPDVELDTRSPEIARRLARARGFRSVLQVPMRREGQVIGVLGITRPETGAFADDEISLAETFADQAVIAIENVRLFKELEARNRDLTDALEQQTATSEILRVISSSPTDVQPVFDTIVQSAARLCHAANAGVFLTDGRTLDLPANYGSSSPEALATVRAQYPRPVDLETTAGVAILTRSVVQVPDIEEPSAAEVYTRRVGRLLGVRSMVAVPMMRKGEVVGAINLSRQAPGRFSDAEVELLKTFADQAVIAIENVRLFTELQEKNQALTQAHAQVSESLEQQTATSEILRVIASSPTDVQPVFDTIAASASRLCGGVAAIVTRFDGEMIHLVAHCNPRPGIEPVTARLYPRRPGRDTTAGRAILECNIVHIRDAEKDPDLAPNLARDVRAGSFLAVPMLRDGRPIGAISVSRAETGAFSAGQVELLKTFADQAVIAIENVRLFTELQEKNQALTAAHAQVSESLEQQTATSEVLRVISQSPTDIQPVLDAVAESAARLCEAYDASIFRRDGDRLLLVAHHGPIHSGLGAFTISLDRGTIGGRTVLDARPFHIGDVQTEATEFPEASENARQLGFRTLLSIPLMRERVAIGVIQLPRREARLFTERQVTLLQTFADQAVIAIENVRLFTELQASNRELTTALDTQTATSDILRVISRSQTDVQPVFDAIVESAVRLLGAYSGGLTRITGDQIELAALTSTDAAGDAATRARYPEPLQSEGMHAQAIRERVPVNIADAHTDPGVPEAEHGRARVRGYRSLVVVPMLR